MACLLILHLKAFQEIRMHLELRTLMLPLQSPTQVSMGSQPLHRDAHAPCPQLSPRSSCLDESFLRLFIHKGLKYQRPNTYESLQLLDDPTQPDGIYRFCMLMRTMALQSEIQFQWNTTERSQLSSINYLCGDNNHGVIPHSRGL